MKYSLNDLYEAGKKQLDASTKIVEDQHKENLASSMIQFKYVADGRIPAELMNHIVGLKNITSRGEWVCTFEHPDYAPMEVTVGTGHIIIDVASSCTPDNGSHRTEFNMDFHSMIHCGSDWAHAVYCARRSRELFNAEKAHRDALVSKYAELETAMQAAEDMTSLVRIVRLVEGVEKGAFLTNNDYAKIEAQAMTTIALLLVRMMESKNG